MKTILSTELHSLLSYIHSQKLLIKEDINTKNIINLAYKHSLVPLLYKSIKQQNPNHTLMTLIKPHYRHIVQNNMSMTIHLISVLQILKKDNIEALTFKGIVLAHLAYKDISLRQFGDIDILIQKKDKARMLKCLLSHGYTPEILLKKSSQKYFFESVNVLGFYTPDGSTLIEVHWELLSKNYAIKWKEARVWENVRVTEIYQIKIPTLNREMTLIYLCIHGTKHLFERFIWLSDIDYWVRSQKNINWEEVIKEAKTLGVFRMLLLSLSLCQIHLKLSLKPLVSDEIQKDKHIQKLAKKITFSSLNNRFRFKFLWQIRERAKDKIRFAYFGIFATKFDDFKWLQVPSSLSFLYFLLRPLRLIWQHFR